MEGVLMEKKQDWKHILKADPTEWLMEDDNPVVRYWTLRDLVDASPGEVEAARQQSSESDVVQEVFRQQKPEGHWENPDNMHAPHYTSTANGLSASSGCASSVARMRWGSPGTGK
jgi:hypothetical protein